MGRVKEVCFSYPCSQLLTLLLLRHQVLGGHLQLKLIQLVLPAHCSEKRKEKKKKRTQEEPWLIIVMTVSMRWWTDGRNVAPTSELQRRKGTLWSGLRNVLLLPRCRLSTRRSYGEASAFTSRTCLQANVEKKRWVGYSRVHVVTGALESVPHLLLDGAPLAAGDMNHGQQLS